MAADSSHQAELYRHYIAALKEEDWRPLLSLKGWSAGKRPGKRRAIASRPGIVAYRTTDTAQAR